MLSRLIILFLLKNILGQSNVQISTPAGQILGTTLTSRLGRTIFAFRRIRFAQPPVGELRFQPPVLIKNWTGVYDATADGPACPQPLPPGVPDFPKSEDCLYLNVYTTKLSDKEEGNPKRPVVVYVHGGSFAVGSGRSDKAGPQYLSDKDIVLVTLNYRLATLGFLSIGKLAPGNNGFKDQVAALKWVQNNIEAFGGDPDHVTLMGTSAGACSISLHLVSPMSSGLFHKAILNSCAFYGGLPIPTNQLQLAKKQARLVDCPDDTPENIYNCLKTKPAQQIADTFFSFWEFGTDPTFIWTPVIEKSYGQKRFLIDQPIRSIIKGKFLQVPVLAGIVKEEFANKALIDLGIPSLVEKLNNEFEKWAPVCFLYERGTSRSLTISKSLRSYYLHDKPVSPSDNNSVVGLRNVYADSIIGFGVNRAVDLFSTYSHKAVYYYKFTYENPNASTPGGPYHGEDYSYLFHEKDSTAPAVEVVELLTSLFTDFAKNCNPTENAQVQWKKYSQECKYYMDISKSLVLRKNMYEERYAFWRKLFPLALYQ